MRYFTRVFVLIVALSIVASNGCSIIGALLGFDESQREWAGNPAEMNERHADESIRHNAEIDRVYN